MEKCIPLSVPNLNGDELVYASEAITSEWISSSGGYVDKLERNIARYLQVDSAVACQSGTAALHLALKLAGVEQGDEVIVPTLTFIATVNPVRYLSAEPVFMDCDNSLNMDLDKLEEFIKRECYVSERGLVNRSTGRIIKALVIVHVFGNMINMEEVMRIACLYGLIIIEDATEAIGTYCTSGKYKGKFAGTIGHFGAYSFNANKIITTGGGGMLIANNPALADRARYLSTQAKDDEINYIHDEVGFNYRMTSLQAALGVAQLEQLERFISIKTQNYQFYKSKIELIEGLSLLDFNANTRANHWFYSLVINGNYRLERDDLLIKLNKACIQSRPIWGLIHQQKPYLHNQSYRVEKAIMLRKRILNIPCSTSLQREDIERVIHVLKTDFT